MAEVTRTIENVDLLFSQIEVNGQTYNSDRYVEPESPSVPPQPSQPNTEEEVTPSVPSDPVQGQDVYAVNLNNVIHDIKDPEVIQDLQNEVRDRQDADQALAGDIQILDGRLDDVEALIPSQATPSNQLADKNFVNSSIATNTANFLGTYTSLADIEAIPDPTNNDYAYLQTTDSAGNTQYDRYKYSAEDNEWLYEYTLNNSSFTAEQWATINSGLTSTSIEDAINELDVPEAGGNGKYIKSISQVNGKIIAVADWLSATGGGVAFIGTRAQYEVAKLIPMGTTGHIPSGALVIITDESAYIEGEDRTNG